MSRDLTILPDERLPVSVGQEIDASDWQQLQNSHDTGIGLLFGALGGTNFRFGNGNSLTVTPAGGLAVKMGGTGGQHIVTQGRICDVCPVQTITLSPAQTSGERLDAIYIQATRVAGSNSLTRNIRSSTQVGPLNIKTVVLLNGFVAANFGTTYTVPPAVIPVPIGADTGAEITISNPTTTSVTVTSTDPNDNRTIDLVVVGNPVNVAGTPTVINTLESTAQYLYVPGTPGSPSAITVNPPPDSTWDLFASILVYANETVTQPADISYIFPLLVSPVNEFVCDSITVGNGYICPTVVMRPDMSTEYGGPYTLTLPNLTPDTYTLVASFAFNPTTGGTLYMQGAGGATWEAERIITFTATAPGVVSPLVLAMLSGTTNASNPSNNPPSVTISFDHPAFGPGIGHLFTLTAYR